MRRRPKVKAVFFIRKILVAKQRCGVCLAPNDHIHFTFALFYEEVYVLRNLRAVAPNIYIRHFHNVPHRFEIHVVNAYGQSVLRKLVVHRLDAPRKFALAARFGRFDKVRRIGYNQVCLNPLLEHFLDAEQTVHIIDLVDFQSFTSHTVRDGMRGIIAHIGVHKQRRID